MELSEDDVLHILKLIDESKFDYFQLEVGELKITVSKGEPIPFNTAPQSAAAAAPAPAAQPAPRPAPAASATSPAAAATAAAPKTTAVPEGMVAITAPLLGTFYVAPEPGAPPFVKVGQQVTETATNTAAAAPRVALLVARANADECDLVAHDDREGFLYDGSVFQRDHAGAERDHKALDASAACEPRFDVVGQTDADEWHAFSDDAVIRRSIQHDVFPHSRAEPLQRNEPRRQNESRRAGARTSGPCRPSCGSERVARRAAARGRRSASSPRSAGSGTRAARRRRPKTARNPAPAGPDRPTLRSLPPWENPCSNSPASTSTAIFRYIAVTISARIGPSAPSNSFFSRSPT